MLERSAKSHLGSITIPFLNSWLGMTMMPACAPIDHTALIQALHRTQNKVLYALVIFTFVGGYFTHGSAMCCTTMCIVVTQGNILVYQGVRKNMNDQVTELSLIKESINIKC